MEDQEPVAGPSRRRDEDESEAKTLRELLALPENENANLVVPLQWCPHLDTIDCNVPEEVKQKLSITEPCLECQNVGENWMCLNCHEVHCSRYVNEHMLFHGIEKEHLLSISFADLSVWCYGCEDYVDHSRLYEAKNLLHRIKFDSDLPLASKTSGTAELQLQ